MRSITRLINFSSEARDFDKLFVVITWDGLSCLSDIELNFHVANMTFHKPDNEMVSLGDTAISLHILLQLPLGGVLGKVRFGLWKEN